MQNVAILLQATKPNGMLQKLCYAETQLNFQ